MTQRAARSILSLSALATAVALSSPALPLEIREGFEWPWNPACLTEGAQWRSCFGVAGCANRRRLFVRRTNPGVCSYTSEVRFWVGGSSRLHGGAVPGAPAPTPPEGMPPNEWVATHVFDRRFVVPNDDTFEVMSTGDRQGSRFGRLQVDLHLHRDVPKSGAGEHYLVMHNLNLTGVSPCPADGPGCPPDRGARTSFGGVEGNPSSYMWYGVIAGAFGAGSEAIPFGSVGFAVEVSAPGAGGNHVIDASFIPYSVDGRQEAFPRGWYRIAVSRSLASGEDTYRFSVLTWDVSAGRWTPIVPDDAAEGGSHQVEIPFSALVQPLGFEIALGYVGLTAAWFGETTGERSPTDHVDWDNLLVDW